jgi:hypothetical protein
MSVTPQRRAELEAMAAQDAGQDYFAMKGEIQQHMSTPQFRMETNANDYTVPRGPGEMHDPRMHDTGGMGGFARQNALPMIGQVAGATAGIPLGPAGVIAGGALGAGAGELGNELLGVGKEQSVMLPPEPVNWGTVGTTTGLTAGFSALSRGWNMLQNFNQSRGPGVLMSAAKDEAMVAAGKIGRVDDFLNTAKMHFQQANIGGLIPMTKLRDVIDEVLPTLKAGSSTARDLTFQARKHINSTLGLVFAKANHMSPNDLQAELFKYDTLIDKVRKSGGAGQGAYQKMRAALSDELHIAADNAEQAYNSGAFKNITNPVAAIHAAGGIGAKALVEARANWMRGTALKDLERWITEAPRALAGQGGTRRFRVEGIINKLEKDKFWNHPSTFSPEQRKGMMDTLDFINKFPQLPTPRGAQMGSGVVLRHGIERIASGVTGALAAGGGAYAAGIHPLASAAIGLAGMGMGAEMQPARELVKNFTTALQMETGQKLIANLWAHSGGRFTDNSAALLGSFVSHMMGDQEQGDASQPQQEGMMP